MTLQMFQRVLQLPHLTRVHNVKLEPLSQPFLVELYLWRIFGNLEPFGSMQPQDSIGQDFGVFPNCHNEPCRASTKVESRAGESTGTKVHVVAKS